MNTVSDDLLVDSIVKRVGVDREVLRKIFPHIPDSKYDLLAARDKANKALTIERHRPFEKRRGVITFYQMNGEGERIKLRSYKSRQKSRQELEMENLIEVKDLLQFFSELECP